MCLFSFTIYRIYVASQHFLFRQVPEWFDGASATWTSNTLLCEWVMCNAGERLLVGVCTSMCRKTGMQHMIDRMLSKADLKDISWRLPVTDCCTDLTNFSSHLTKFCTGQGDLVQAWQLYYLPVTSSYSTEQAKVQTRQKYIDLAALGQTRQKYRHGSFSTDQATLVHTRQL